MKSIKKLKNLKGKRVLVRVDFNVPIENGKVADPFRITKALPTIKYLQKAGAKVILVAHLGDDGTKSLLPVSKALGKFLKHSFCKETILSKEESMKLVNGSVTLLENIRKEKGEKKNDQKLAQKLATMADIYVNDAFSVSHRAHASVVGVAKKLPRYAGLQLEQEVFHLAQVFKPKHPFLFILGGAKFATKLPLIKKYLKSADALFIGGALANTFISSEGFQIGRSLTDRDAQGIKTLLKNKKIQVPSDVFVTEDISEKKYGGRVKKANEVGKDDYIVDIGPESLSVLVAKIVMAKFVLWNGPLGKSGYDAGTEIALEALALATKKGATSIIGGGDTAEIISKKKMEHQFTFVSTGGGATLEYLAKGTLPGIKALN